IGAASTGAMSECRQHPVAHPASRKSSGADIRRHLLHAYRVVIQLSDLIFLPARPVKTKRALRSG
ncbi:MAG: hypothetical protein J0H31_09705, partial [Alphaproteobacteria bacterium]|nr:hypothetical protein [Alphaproteobacteria bacterium]